MESRPNNSLYIQNSTIHHYGFSVTNHIPMNRVLKSLILFFLLQVSVGLCAQEAQVFVNRDEVFQQDLLDRNRETIEHELVQMLLLLKRHLPAQESTVLKGFETRYEVLAAKANGVYGSAARKIAAGWITDGIPLEKVPELKARLDEVTAEGILLQRDMESAIHATGQKEELLAHNGTEFVVEVTAAFAVVWKLITDINKRLTCKRAQKLYLASYWPPLSDIYDPTVLTPINWSTIVDVNCAEKIQKWDAKGESDRE